MLRNLARQLNLKNKSHFIVFRSFFKYVFIVVFSLISLKIDLTHKLYMIGVSKLYI